MSYKLSSHVEVGSIIYLASGWEKIVSKFEDMVVTDKGTEVRFGETIHGWQARAEHATTEDEEVSEFERWQKFENNNITKTIKENMEKYTDFHAEVHSGTKCPFGKIKSHLLQSQIRLIDVQIANLKKEYKKAFEAYQFSEATREFFRGKLDALEDQISSLEEVKKDLLNN